MYKSVCISVCPVPLLTVLEIQEKNVSCLQVRAPNLLVRVNSLPHCHLAGWKVLVWVSTCDEPSIPVVRSKSELEENILEER